jgi:hypothetical protein
VVLRTSFDSSTCSEGTCRRFLLALTFRRANCPSAMSFVSVLVPFCPILSSFVLICPILSSLVPSRFCPRLGQNGTFLSQMGQKRSSTENISLSTAFQRDFCTTRTSNWDKLGQKRSSTEIGTNWDKNGVAPKILGQNGTIWDRNGVAPKISLRLEDKLGQKRSSTERAARASTVTNACCCCLPVVVCGKCRFVFCFCCLSLLLSPLLPPFHHGCGH